jgi:protein involved in polysaccharide export with SLBB domain
MKTLLLALLLTGGQAAVQQPAPAAPEEYVVGPQDVLTLTIFNDDTMSRPALIVDNDGTIDCPLLGRMKVVGKTSRQIEEDLRGRYGPKRDATGKVIGGISAWSSRSSAASVSRCRDPSERLGKWTFRGIRRSRARLRRLATR